MNCRASTDLVQSENQAIFDIEGIILTKDELQISVRNAVAFSYHEAASLFPHGSIERYESGSMQTENMYNFFEAAEFMLFCWLTNFLPVEQARSVSNHFTTIISEEID